MGNGVFAAAAVGAFVLLVSVRASAQAGPASTQGAPPPLPALPAAAPPPPAAPSPAPSVAWAPGAGVEPGIELHLEGHALHVRVGAQEAILDIGCAGRSSLQQGDRAFVACGVDGVVEVDLSNPLAPRRAGSMAVEGEATSLFARDGRVWVEISRYLARPVHTGDGSGEGPAPETPAVAVQARPSLMAPPRRGGLWELSAEGGAFVNLGPTSGGLMLWATAAYRFDLPVVVRLELAPIAFGAGSGITTITSQPSLVTTLGTSVGTASSSSSNSGSIAVGAVQALVGIDTQFIEVAVGGGASTIGSTSGPSTGGGTIAAEARFGAHDGLALTLESIVVGANGQFQLACFVTTIQIPLTTSVMLVARGGGGNVGLVYGDLGARVVVAGDGGKGTIALTGFFGGEGINYQGCQSGTAETCPNASLGGPSIGGGIEWRR
jgi:hypothetical protein